MAIIRSFAWWIPITLWMMAPSSRAQETPPHAETRLQQTYIVQFDMDAIASAQEMLETISLLNMGGWGRPSGHDQCTFKKTLGLIYTATIQGATCSVEVKCPTEEEANAVLEEIVAAWSAPRIKGVYKNGPVHKAVIP